MQSMTGFGKADLQTEAYEVTVEIKAVNHRFLDIQMRLPRELNSIEQTLKKQVKEHLLRGRIECFVTLRMINQSQQQVKINQTLLQQLVTDLSAMETSFTSESGVTANSLLQGAIMHPALFEVVDSGNLPEALFVDLQELFTIALTQLQQNRTLEGAGILAVLEAKLDLLDNRLVMIHELQADYEADYREKLQKKVFDLLGGQVDETRLLTEVALQLEKADIGEELDRLRIHSQNYRQLLKKAGAIGKEADFLTQELNREINTIGSKTSVMIIKEHVIFLKTTIEQIREQIQNVE
ncbi:YicC family protein [Vagococcus penaei]|uniref:YicC family protein n=1 Tax=Vagococcus penaei TaxID=633807 RepID=A0A1Q2D6R3_9ENTE|nr:YicC/YloC family endoribonuclease [Vagococcus penaei]AQP54054.1 YicC family protein [Vagococcus penaei]RSU01712.1 YicC family protein [Vagococcus penaei]